MVTFAVILILIIAITLQHPIYGQLQAIIVSDFIIISILQFRIHSIFSHAIKCIASSPISKWYVMLLSVTSNFTTTLQNKKHILVYSREQLELD